MMIQYSARGKQRQFRSGMNHTFNINAFYSLPDLNLTVHSVPAEKQ